MKITRGKLKKLRSLSQISKIKKHILSQQTNGDKNNITIIMYTFILRLAIRMYTIELGKTSKTEIFFYLFLYIRTLGGLVA